MEVNANLDEQRGTRPIEYTAELQWVLLGQLNERNRHEQHFACNGRQRKPRCTDTLNDEN